MPDAVKTFPPAFLEAFAQVIGIEGGFTRDPKDKGNWTGGKCGVGILQGTKYGISAARYPNLDIEHLTLDEARALYFWDFWKELGLDRIDDAQIAGELFDTAVNCGPGEAGKDAQKALRYLGEIILVDGIIGKDTIGLLNKWCAKDAPALMKAVNGYQFMHYEAIVMAALANPADFRERYAHGWLKRIQGYRGKA